MNVVADLQIITMLVLGDIQQITSGQITFASAPQMTVAISKDFIQQAAAESGVTIGLNNNNAVQAQIYPEQPR